jgi:DNA-binding response OmpR family regulator
MKILLLEDNKKLNNSIVKRLTLKGYRVDSFEDGQEAYMHMDEGYHCFVLDINVPSINGVELLKRIREYYDEIPVIIVSATVELDVIRDAYGFGCDDFIKKPFFIDELEIKIAKLCNIDHAVLYFGEDGVFEYKTSLFRRGNETYHLSKKERLLINLFLTHTDQVITFETIQNYVWEGNVVSLDSIRSLVRRVRKLFGNDVIETLIGIGYILKTQ